MATLNKAAAESLQGLDVHAVTDVTGFGLLGHLLEVVNASHVSASIRMPSVPVVDNVWDLAREGIYPGGAKRNLDRVDPQIHWPDNFPDEHKIVLADPQTSGGLLIAIAANDADELLRRLQSNQTPAHHIVGTVTSDPWGVIQVTNE
jgi:selenide,water dikinase